MYVSNDFCSVCDLRLVWSFFRFVFFPGVYDGHGLDC
jgi:hypothetical protein